MLQGVLDAKHMALIKPASEDMDMGWVAPGMLRGRRLAAPRNAGGTQHQAQPAHACLGQPHPVSAPLEVGPAAAAAALEAPLVWVAVQELLSQTAWLHPYWPSHHWPSRAVAGFSAAAPSGAVPQLSSIRNGNFTDWSEG